MRKYELLCILKTGMDTEKVDQAIDNIQKAVENTGGKVFSADKIGRKKLAYDIQKSRDAFYVNFELEIPQEKIVSFKRTLKLDENVLRNMLTLQKKKVAVASK